MAKLLVAIGMSVAIVVSSAASSLAGNWWENIKFKGDLRYRHEMIDKEGKDVRNRQRIRARFGLEGKVSDATKVKVQLATGSDDPVSTNQTLGDAFSSKSVVLDMAYFETKPAFAEGLAVKGGKFGNPFFKPGKSELVWDSDFNPEGGVAAFNHKMENVTITLIGAGLWIEERKEGDDAWIGAGQGVARFDINEGRSSVAVGGSYFNYGNTEGYEAFHETDDPKGNTLHEVDSVYATDYDLFEGYVEFSHKFDQIPVTVMGDFVKNTAADSCDTGWLVGLHVGKTKKPGSWAFRYIYREVEKDAVLGAFTDSDFRGGGTDAKGHELGGSYQLAEKATFSVSYFMNEIGLDAEETTDFNRLQVDLQLKF